MKLLNVNNFSRSVVKLLEDRIHPQRGTSPSASVNDLKPVKRDDLSSFKKVGVKGLGIEEGVTVLPNDFQVHLKDLEFENLSIDIQGPSYIRLDHQVFDSGIVKISYKVTQVGTYFFEIKYQGVHVPGSPFNVKVRECEVKPVKAAPVYNCKAVAAYGKGLKLSKQGEVASFQIDTRKAGVGGRLGVYVDCPESGAECDILYTVTREGCKVQYICPTEGFYFLRVKYNGKHITGSPFRAQCIGADSEAHGLLSSLRIKRKDPVVDDKKIKRHLAVL